MNAAPTLTHQRRLRSAGQAVLVAILAGLATGAVAAYSVRDALGAIAACAFAVALHSGLRATLALWIPAFFVTFLSPGNAALKVGAAFAGLAFLVTCVREWPEVRRSLQVAGPILGISALLLAWLTLSSLWAQRSDLALLQMRWYGLCALLFVGIVISVRSGHDLRVLVTSFVVGALLTCLVAFAGVNDRSGVVIQHAGATIQTHGARLEGGSGDPNVFAAALLAAIALAGGLALTSRRGGMRFPLLILIALFGIGVIGSQSRGGFIAVGFAAIAAVCVLRGHRAKVVGLVVASAAVVGIWVAAFGGSLARLTNFSDQGDGRDELWRIAWKMAQGHPINGIGLENFIPRAPEYVLLPGSIQFIHLIIERPVVVHNTFLQFLAETGIVGLALFTCLVAMSLRSLVVAGNWFDANGDRDLATVCRCSFVGAIALLVAGFFFSSGVDYKMWLLLGLGPAALVVAERRRFDALSGHGQHPGRFSSGPFSWNRQRAGSGSLRSAPAPRIAMVTTSPSESSGAVERLLRQETLELVSIRQPGDAAEAFADESRGPHRLVTIEYLAGETAAGLCRRILDRTSAPYIFVTPADVEVDRQGLVLLADVLDRDHGLGAVWGDEMRAGDGAANPCATALDPWEVTYVNAMPSKALVRREALEAANRWSLRSPALDWHFWLTLAAEGWRGRRVEGVTYGVSGAMETKMVKPRGDTVAALKDSYPRLYRARRLNWWRSSAPLETRLLFPIVERLPLPAGAKAHLLLTIWTLGADRRG